jgi:hypothetical protein
MAKATILREKKRCQEKERVICRNINMERERDKYKEI